MHCWSKGEGKACKAKGSLWLPYELASLQCLAGRSRKIRESFAKKSIGWESVAQRLSSNVAASRYERSSDRFCN